MKVILVDPLIMKALPVPRAALESTPPLAKTAAGKVRGAIIDGVYVFKGIHYDDADSAANGAGA